MKKRQHYVPQFYLRNFEDGRNKLHVYNRKKDRFFMSQVKDICREKYLYETQWENAALFLGEYVLPNEIEDDFSRQENEYNVLLKRIISICSDPVNKNALICRHEQKEGIALFAANMLLRNPWSMMQFGVDDIPKEVMENSEIYGINQMLKAMNFVGVESLIKHANKKVLLDHKLNGEENMPTLVANDLKKMDMCFLVTQNFSFVTSSFPVIFEFYDTEDGIVHLKYLFIPLCPKVGLQYSIDSKIKCPRNRQVHIPDEAVLEINRLFLKKDSNQIQYIISHSEKILKSVIKND